MHYFKVFFVIYDGYWLGPLTF